MAHYFYCPSCRCQINKERLGAENIIRGYGACPNCGQSISIEAVFRGGYDAVPRPAEPLKAREILMIGTHVLIWGSAVVAFVVNLFIYGLDACSLIFGIALWSFLLFGLPAYFFGDRAPAWLSALWMVLFGLFVNLVIYAAMLGYLPALQ